MKIEYCYFYLFVHRDGAETEAERGGGRVGLEMMNGVERFAGLGLLINSGLPNIENTALV